jgi:hypothetical protein
MVPKLAAYLKTTIADILVEFGDDANRPDAQGKD